MSHPYRTPATCIPKFNPITMRPPPQKEDWCDCCGWDLRRPIKDAYWYKYVWCRDCLEHYGSFLAERGLSFDGRRGVHNNGRHHSWLYLAYNDWEIEILKSVVTDYHIPLVRYWQIEDMMATVRNNHEQVTRVIATLRPVKPSRLERIKQIAFDVITAICKWHLARFMP